MAIPTQQNAVMPTQQTQQSGVAPPFPRPNQAAPTSGLGGTAGGSIGQAIQNGATVQSAGNFDWGAAYAQQQGNQSQPAPMQMQPTPLGGMTAQAGPSMQPQGGNMGQAGQNNGMTPGGLQGSIGGQQYAPNPNIQRPDFNNQNGGQNGGSRSSFYGHLQGGGGSPQGNAQGQQMPSVGDFSRYEDGALANAMRTLQPQMDSNNAAFEQQMVSRGIQPGTAQYDAQRANLDRRNNDMLTSAEYGAQGQGLAAQQQAYAQQYGYDALANALNQTQIGADASMYGADRSSAASMYGSDASMANAQTGANASMYNNDMNNSLGWAGLNEQGRQFNINDIFRTNGQDIDAALGFGQLGLGQQGMDINAFNAQNNANNQWWNQIGGMTANAPGVNFRPTGDVAGSMQNAGNNMANAQQAQNQGYAQLAGSLFGAFSDERLKENIELVDNVDGVNVYEFDYINKEHGAERYSGVMAQEVMIDYPNAVFVDSTGYYKVDYNQLPVNMEVI